MAALEPRIHELLPYLRQVLHRRPEQVDSLATGDLGVQAVLDAHISNDTEARWRDLSPRDAWDDAVGARPLDVGQEPVVGVLQNVAAAREDVLVPQRCQDGGNGWLARLATLGVAFADVVEDLLVRFEPLDLNDVEQLLPGQREVRTDAAERILTHFLEGVGKDLLYGAGDNASAAPRAALGGLLELLQSAHTLVLHCRIDVALGDAETGAHHISVVQPAIGLLLSRPSKAHELGWRLAVEVTPLGCRQQPCVVGHIAHEHATEQEISCRVEDELLVVPKEGIRLREGDGLCGVISLELVLEPEVI
mmetsp:Transcript_45059/g.127190  ORF Transcript_45059/g.127190 Transcript_45059/m.127190 type:complete len:306 (+) Transcript_45059:1471-2388(+)